MILYILRGIPGAGKSTVAKTLVPEDCICEADQYHMVDGVYKFDIELMGEAHKYCQDKCRKLMINNAPKIVVSNTSTTDNEVNTYRKIAEEYGYTVYTLLIENRHGGVNQHNVPQKTLDNMKEKLKRSIVL